MKKNVLITGAASGFGRLAAELLVKEGYRVFATMRDVESRRANDADELKAQAKGLPGELFLYDMDVSSDSAVINTVESIIAEHGHIDVVVNNAGIIGMGVNEALGLDPLQKMMDINVYGAIRVNNAVIPSMRERGSGLLVQITSVTTCYSLPSASAYAASKVAAERIAEGYRYDLSQFGIDSVIIQPGAFPTEIMGKMLPPAHPEKMQKYAALGPILEKFSKNYQGLVFGEQPADPQIVADTLLNLIEVPVGERPLRTIADVKTDDFVEPVNEQLQQTQNKIMEQLDISELVQPKQV